MPICAECGASLPEGRSCQEIFDKYLALEFSDPGYGAVHFLTVSCFMVQHGRYSDEALVWMRAQLRAYLEEGKPIDEVRSAAQQSASNTSRTWKVLRAPDAPPLPKINWSMTLADVDRQQQDAASYRALVRQWAETTLREMG
jgi:hypothetical protein